MITVINIKANSLPDGWIYIGHANPKLKLAQSPLVNPWTLDKEADRPIVMEKYKRHLWGEIKRYDSEARLELFRLVRLARKGELYIGCYSAPKACHGDIIKAAIEWVLENGVPWARRHDNVLGVSSRRAEGSPLARPLSSIYIEAGLA